MSGSDRRGSDISPIQYFLKHCSIIVVEFDAQWNALCIVKKDTDSASFIDSTACDMVYGIFSLVFLIDIKVIVKVIVMKEFVLKISPFL